MEKRQAVLSILTIVFLLALACGASGCKKGQTLEDWQHIIENETGKDSIESETVRECIKGIETKMAECSVNEGWTVDTQVSITEFKTDRKFDINDMKRGGCKSSFKKEDPRPFTVDSAYFDAMSERNATSYQIVCKIACYSWPCKAETTPEAKTSYPSSGAWKGEFKWYFPDECYKNAVGYGTGYLLGTYEKTKNGPKLYNFRLTPSMPYSNPNNGEALKEGVKYEWDGNAGSSRYHFEGTLQGKTFSGEITLYERCSDALPSNNIQKAKFSMDIVSS